mgnify:CR=1 FL=1
MAWCQHHLVSAFCFFGFEGFAYDMVVEDGKEKRVLNKKETMLASQKQETIREAFKDWVFKEPQRREELVKKYLMNI